MSTLNDEERRRSGFGRVEVETGIALLNLYHQHRTAFEHGSVDSPYHVDVFTCIPSVVLVGVAPSR